MSIFRHGQESGLVVDYELLLINNTVLGIIPVQETDLFSKGTFISSHYLSKMTTLTLESRLSPLYPPMLWSTTMKML